MRKHGWQLPYHPLQVVAIAVFLALGFAFYVFFLPFVGRKLFEYVVMGIYTPLVSCVFCLYIWCAATNPADPGVFKLKKYTVVEEKVKQFHPKETGRDPAEGGDEQQTESTVVGSSEKKLSERTEVPSRSCCRATSLGFLFGWLISCCRSGANEISSEQQTSDESMFYCSLCEVEVRKYSKHCRVCDKCVDGFDHHCRWLNNCIGRKNYRKFFILMVSALLLLIFQWSIGILVLILCFLERTRYSTEISTKLGSGFSLVPFVIVVASCTLLALIATLPLAQLFFFHVLLARKGISTYDYIIALREQEQQEGGGGGGQQSPQMSQVSSFTALSSTSSFGALHRAAWCTPPRLFVDDQFVIPPGSGLPANLGLKKVTSEPPKIKNTATVKISPWTLARLNSEEISKAAEEARRKSKILHPISKQGDPLGPDTGSSDSKRRQLINLPAERLAKISASPSDSNSSGEVSAASACLAPLQLEARSAFRAANRAVIPMTGLVPCSSPDSSSLGSPDLLPFRISAGADGDVLPPSRSTVGVSGHKFGIELSRSTSDGYDASGGEDSDRVPSRIVHKPTNWSSVLFKSGRVNFSDTWKPPPSNS